jgi:hypothetical protein
MEFLIILAAIIGVIKGLTSTEPSFWRGFGAGLASKDNGKGKVSFYYTDRKSGIGFKID